MTRVGFGLRAAAFILLQSLAGILVAGGVVVVLMFYGLMWDHISIAIH